MKSAYLVRVVGRSMEPTLQKGDRVLVLSSPTPQKGDIVLLRREDKFLLHRVLFFFDSKGESYFVHCGDSAQEPGIARKSAIQGVAQALYRERALSPLPSPKKLAFGERSLRLYLLFWKFFHTLTPHPPRFLKIFSRFFWNMTSMRT